jgi:hypothetical protein
MSKGVIKSAAVTNSHVHVHVPPTHTHTHTHTPARTHTHPRTHTHTHTYFFIVSLNVRAQNSSGTIQMCLQTDMFTFIIINFPPPLPFLTRFYANNEYLMSKYFYRIP